MRRRRTNKEWQELIKRYNKSGLSVTEFCQDESIHPNQLYKKKRELRNNETSSFVKLAPGKNPASSYEIVIEYGGFRIKVPPGCNPVTLQNILMSIRRVVNA